jgi:small multidrug resistance pump
MLEQTLELLPGRGRMAMWFWLAGAIVAEVTATLSLRYAEGFTRLFPSIIVVIGYAVAFYALSQSLSRGMVLAVAYGVWSAAGVALIAVIGATVLHEPLSWVQVGGVALVIAGVLALELGGSTHTS